MATGADEAIARGVADYLQLFDTILASNGTTNLSAQRKRDRLVGEFGEKGFDYAGNDRRDLVVWSSARKAIVVSSSRSLPGIAARVAGIERVFAGREKWFKPYMKALRLHQWLKNLLVFVPLVMAHRFLELDLLAKTFLAFLAFGLCASSAYLLNDLLDMPADRHHPRKRQRPFAAGELSLFLGLISIPLLLGFSLLVSLFLPSPFLGMLVYLLSSESGLLFLPQTSCALRRYGPCRAIHLARHGRFGIRHDLALGLAFSLLNFPFFEPRPGQTLCRAGNHGN